MFDVDDGIVSNTSHRINSTIPIVAFLSVALYNVVELIFIMIASFKKHSGLYFWSFLTSTLGIVPYSLGFLFKGLGTNPHALMVYVTMILVGWACMVTGQSVILYSRLHLVDRNRKRLRAVLIMIICNAIICHIPIAVFLYGANHTRERVFLVGYSVYENIQVSIFFVQETIISGLYIFATWRFFRRTNLHHKSTRKRIMWHLAIINVIVILLDITILGLEYAGYYELQTSYKGLVYSIKLKLEFDILNKLATLASRGDSDMTKSYMRDAQQLEPVEDHIFDGSRRPPGGTCLDSRGQCLETMDGRTCTRHRHTSQKGSMMHPTPMFFSAITQTSCRRDSGHPAGGVGSQTGGNSLRVPGTGPSDGIVVRTTTSVDVSQDRDREDEVERQWRSLGRISSEGPEAPAPVVVAGEAGASSTSSSQKELNIISAV